MIDETFWIVQVAFFVSKLVGLVTWSWWIVFIPSFIYIAIVIVLLVLIGVLVVNDY